MEYDWKVTEFEFDGKWHANVISRTGTVMYTTEGGETQEDAS